MTALRATEWDRLPPPKDMAETMARAASRRARMEAGVRGPIAERSVPHFVRIAGDGRQTAEWIAEEVAKTYGVRGDADLAFFFSRQRHARDALCYWLLGLTRMTTGDVARACALGGAGEAAEAMRRHARRSAFPVLDLSDDARGLS